MTGTAQAATLVAQQATLQALQATKTPSSTPNLSETALTSPSATNTSMPSRTPRPSRTPSSPAPPTPTVAGGGPITGANPTFFSCTYVQNTTDYECLTNIGVGGGTAPFTITIDGRADQTGVQTPQNPYFFQLRGRRCIVRLFSYRVVDANGQVFDGSGSFDPMAYKLFNNNTEVCGLATHTQVPSTYTPTSTLTTATRTQVPSTYTPTSTPTTATRTQISPTRTQVPALTAETRTVSIDWPSKMLLGASSDVILTFNPDTGQVIALVTASTGTGLAATPITTSTSQTTAIAANMREPNRSVFYSLPMTIPAVFDQYRVFAIARLDASGFIYSPREAVQYPVSLGKGLTWRWSIRPEDAEQQKLIISLQLHFEPKSNDVPLLDDQPMWSDSFPVDVRKTLFGLTTTQMNTGAGIMAVCGFISTLYGLWEKIGLKKKHSSIERSKQMGKKRRRK